MGRPYAWNVAPSYPACTDPGDGAQLTDGQYSTGMFWGDTSTVGWEYQNLVTIAIDLGVVQPIQGVSFNTAAGGSGVLWPQAIDVLVSADGAAYYPAGELTGLSSEHGLPRQDSGYAVHRYWTDRLSTHGRYVQFVVVNEPYVFVDEIEVYRGPDAMLTAALPDAPVTDWPTYLKANNVQAGLIRRIVQDAQDILTQANADPQLPASERDVIVSELNTVIVDAAGLPPVDPNTFQTVLPLNNLHASVFRAQARLWRGQGRANLTAWQVPLWAPLSPTEPPDLKAPPSVDVTVMKGEFRAGALNLSNATDTDVTATVNIVGLPEGTNPSYVRMQEVAWTDTKVGVPVAAALPDAGRTDQGFTIQIPSGMTRQVWLTFHPTTTAAGAYIGSVEVDGGAAGTASVPIRFRLSAWQFPAQPTLSLGGWDYTDGYYQYGLTLQNRAPFIAHLREHFVDTTWGTVGEVMPNPPEFVNFDAWAARWSNVRNYRIFLNVNPTFGGYAMGTPDFNQAVGVWVSAYAAHWTGMGLSLSQIALLLKDEPQTEESSNAIIAWATAIHQAVPGIQIWENPRYADPAQGTAMAQVCDVLCLHRPDFIAGSDAYRAAWRQQLAGGQKQLNFYSALGPARRLDPYSYYRLQAWTCWKEGAAAMLYWGFADNGGASSWNDYAGYCDYTPLYLDASTVTGGKQMEAIREGVEDYEYLLLLRNRIQELRATGNPPPEVDAADTLLATAADRVLTAPSAGQLYWWQEKDRGPADMVRIEVLDMLETLGVPP